MCSILIEGIIKSPKVGRLIVFALFLLLLSAQFSPDELSVATGLTVLKLGIW